MNKRIAVITAGGAAPALIVNRLKRDFPDLLLVIEEPESKSAFLKRRAKKIGWFQTLAQLPTQFLSKFGKAHAANRYREIEEQFGLSMVMPADLTTERITSVNDGSNGDSLSDLLTRHDIDLAFVVGGRMMAQKTLADIHCPILNFHAGFTPDYRGVNGGYWALAEGKPTRFGGTIHLIDAGVDTGDVIAQIQCKPDMADNFLTYQHSITAQCADGCAKAINDMLNGIAKPFQPSGQSKQHYHPAIYAYLWTGLTKKVW